MARLFVQVRTDYTPREDFSHVEVHAVRTDKPHKNHFSVHTVGRGEEFERGQTVAGFRKIKKRRKHRVVVRLLDPRGRSVDMRIVGILPGSRRRLLVIDFAEA